jgi:hypothetical protein
MDNHKQARYEQLDINGEWVDSVSGNTLPVFNQIKIVLIRLGIP